MLSLNAHKSTEPFWNALEDMRPDLPTIEPDAVNDHANGAKYIKLPSLHKLIYPVLRKHRFYIIHEALFRPVATVGRYELHSTLKHREHEGWNTTVFPLTMEKTNKSGVLVYDAQAYGGSLSYGRRYNTYVLLNIATDDDDDDGNSISVRGIQAFDNTRGPANFNAGKIPPTSKLTF